MVKVRVLKNSDVKFMAAFIPHGHRHVRVLINIGDEILILQQATIDALIRAYTSVALHPLRKAHALILKKLPSKERKEGFAEYQLVEVSIDEDMLIRALTTLYTKYLRSKHNQSVVKT